MILHTQTMVIVLRMSKVLHCLSKNQMQVLLRWEGPNKHNFDGDVHKSPPQKNATIQGHVRTLTKKGHDFIVNKKRKKKCDEKFDAIAKLTTYAT